MGPQDTVGGKETQRMAPESRGWEPGRCCHGLVVLVGEVQAERRGWEEPLRPDSHLLTRYPSGRGRPKLCLFTPYFFYLKRAFLSHLKSFRK